MWFKNVNINKTTSTKYAEELVKAEITAEDLPELDHDILREINIIIPGYKAKILRKAKCSESLSAKKLSNQM